MNRIEYVYPDGGLLAPNPSPYGISWSAVIVWRNYVTDKIETAETHHFAMPKAFGLETVENNLAETMAIVHALEFIAAIATHKKVDASRFIVRGDNQNAIRRAIAPSTAKMGGVPDSIVQRLITVTRKFPHVSYKLIGGSMKTGDLERGYREDGTKVYRENVRADYLCRLELYRAALAMGLIDPDAKFPRPKIGCKSAEVIPHSFRRDVDDLRARIKRNLDQSRKPTSYRPADEVYDFAPTLPDFGDEMGG